MVNFGEVLKVAASQIHCPHLHAGAPGIYSDLLRSVQMLKREWGAERNGKLPHLSIPSKIAVWVPEFAVEDLPLSRTAALVPEVAVKDLPLGRILDDDDDDDRLLKECIIIANNNLYLK